MAVKYMPTLMITIAMLAMLWGRSMLMTSAPSLTAPALPGDTMIVRTRHAQRIIIDTGNDAPQLLDMLGSDSSLWQARSADIVVLTQTGAAWQGALAALGTHGVAQLIILPAAQQGAEAVCAQRVTPCVFVAVGDSWQHDDVTVHVVAPNVLWLVWAYGSMLVAHGATTTQLNALAPSLQCPRPLCLVSYGWRITPPWQLHQHLHLTGVLYADGQSQDPAARLSMAQRRPYREYLWHEQLVGTWSLTLDNPPHIRVSEVWP